MRTFVIGSKKLSVDILEILLHQGHEVLGVITRDEEPGMKVWLEQLHHPSLARVAAEYGLPVHEGLNVNSPECRELLKSLDLDVIFSCCWGEIFRAETLSIPRLGVFNFHTAYLPKNRGSRPIPWALIRGEEYTGLTIHRMDEGVDSGPILVQSKVPIGVEDTAASLYQKVTASGASLLEEILPEFETRATALQAQHEEQATYQPRGEPYGGQIDPRWDDVQRARFERAFFFPPFRGSRPAPRACRVAKSPSLLLVDTAELTIKNLPGHAKGWRQRNIGNRDERKTLSDFFLAFDFEKEALNADLDGCYPVHDVALRRGPGFLAVVTDQQDERAYPYRAENGLLLIPIMRFENLNAMHALVPRWEEWMKEFGRDYILAPVFSDNSVFDQVCEEFKISPEQVLSFSEVYDHFNTDYEDHSP